MTLIERIRAAIQAIIDDEGQGEGWTLSQFITVMGLERMHSDGTVESTVWYWHPPDQPDWMAVGLLEAGMEIRDCTDAED